MNQIHTYGIDLRGTFDETAVLMVLDSISEIIFIRCLFIFLRRRIGSSELVGATHKIFCHFDIVVRPGPSEECPMSTTFLNCINV